MELIYWPSFFFLLFAGIACAFAVAVVLSANIVRMAFYLVLSLAATAGFSSWRAVKRVCTATFSPFGPGSR